MTDIIQAWAEEAAMRIEGTTALVTGANRGIGKAFADALLERGAAKVYAAVRDLATVSDADPRLVGVQLDVTDGFDRHDAGIRGVFVGFVDTDLTAGLDLDKVEPAAVAAAAFDAVEAGEPEAVVDDFSCGVKAALSDDQRPLYPQVERDFTNLVGGRA
jgi:NAD(P)-dependent dehydrogenase (short-subunit alcohol dehydrogenase family)